MITIRLVDSTQSMPYIFGGFTALQNYAFRAIITGTKKGKEEKIMRITEISAINKQTGLTIEIPKDKVNLDNLNIRQTDASFYKTFPAMGASRAVVVGNE